MTVDEARSQYPADVVDLAVDMADATAAIVAELPNPSMFVRDTYADVCWRVAGHEACRTVELLAAWFAKDRLGVAA